MESALAGKPLRSLFILMRWIGLGIAMSKCLRDPLSGRTVILQRISQPVAGADSLQTSEACLASVPGFLYPPG